MKVPRSRKDETMRALVVYESMFGNTEVVAEAIADGLSPYMTVDVAEVNTAPHSIGDDLDLLVVGGPTHAFGMSRSSTRQDVVGHGGAIATSSGIGIREWLDALPSAPAACPAAAFDTRVDRPRLPGSAARAIRRQLRRKGFDAGSPAKSFYVSGKTGPLVDGEQARARRWGEEIGEWGP